MLSNLNGMSVEHLFFIDLLYVVEYLLNYFSEQIDWS